MKPGWCETLLCLFWGVFVKPLGSTCIFGLLSFDAEDAHGPIAPWSRNNLTQKGSCNPHHLPAATLGADGEDPAISPQKRMGTMYQHDTAHVWSAGASQQELGSHSCSANPALPVAGWAWKILVIHRAHP